MEFTRHHTGKKKVHYFLKFNVQLFLMQIVNHVYFSPDGKWIASGSFDKSVKLWNGITGDFVAAFRGHVGPVYQIRFVYSIV